MGSATGESMIVMYRLFILGFIVFVVLGISSGIYDYEVNVRDRDAMLLTRAMMDCLIVDGVLDLDSLNEEARKNAFSFCGFEEEEMERFFFSMEVNDDIHEIDKLIAGDDNLFWIRKIYTSDLKTDSIKAYEPGYFNGVFDIIVLKNEIKLKGNIRIEVIVKSEE